jgi:VWFA-related protein
MRRSRLVARIALGTAAGLLAMSPGPVALGQSQASQGQPGGQAQAPTFRATTALVEVDAVVHDRNGAFVPALTADDLEIYEDGKLQRIEQFYMVSQSQARQVLPGAGGSAVLPEDRARRIFVLVFDEGHLAHESLLRAKAGAERFVRENLGPNDFGGIFVNGGMYHGRLTSSRAELVAGIHTVKVGFESRQSLLAPFREFPRIPGEIDAVRIAEGSLEVANRLGQKACEEDPFSCQLNGGQNQVENLIQQKARLYVRQARILTSNTLRSLRYVVDRLARIPGRKTVVLLSEGFFVEDSRSDLQAIAAAAARGSSTIYSIDGRGLIGAPSVASDVLTTAAGRSTAFDTGDDGPNILTAGTGGLRVYNIDDIARAFGIIAQDTSNYYVIGYQPDNPRMDGTFRKIEVKSRISGLKVRSRKGYQAVALPPLEPVRTMWK